MIPVSSSQGFSPLFSLSLYSPLLLHQQARARAHTHITRAYTRPHTQNGPCVCEASSAGPRPSLWGSSVGVAVVNARSLGGPAASPLNVGDSRHRGTCHCIRWPGLQAGGQAGSASVLLESILPAESLPGAAHCGQAPGGRSWAPPTGHSAWVCIIAPPGTPLSGANPPTRISTVPSPYHQCLLESKLFGFLFPDQLTATMAHPEKLEGITEFEKLRVELFKYKIKKKKQ